MEVTAIILAGGKNLRLGRSKALEVIGGKSLIERVVERLEAVTNELIIVTSEEQANLPAISGVEVLTDVFPGRGPLGGIYTGLMAAQSSLSIAVACDMPFLNTELLSHMVGLCRDFDAVVPQLANGMIEPLHSIYSRSCLAEMQRRLDNNYLGVTPFLKSQHVRYIEEAECRRFDPELLTFFNINDQADLDKAARLAEERGY
jgi:molybdopterin-guanine dinucleotide biosynthesis protein A